MASAPLVGLVLDLVGGEDGLLDRLRRIGGRSCRPVLVQLGLSAGNLLARYRGTTCAGDGRGDEEQGESDDGGRRGGYQRTNGCRGANFDQLLCGPTGLADGLALKEPRFRW